MGIAALGNTPLVSPFRDKEIGWTQKIVVARLMAAAQAGDRGELRRIHNKYLEALVNGAIEEINPQGLVKPQELLAPTDDVIARLQRRANEFASRRADALREVAEAASAGVPLAVQETEQLDYRLPPVSRAMLELEGKRAPKDTPETFARQLLVAKKRAFELARLLRARLALAAQRDELTNPATTATAVGDEEILFSLNTALTAAKSDRVGTSILEITTCGAVAPYNHLLGGKLVALLLLSPEVADDYGRRYADRPAIISSQLKNVERTKDCTLAWLNTTGLYSLGSSQYERLRLPAGTISPEQEELRFKHIGDTEGYGTVQFSEATVQAVQAALEELRQFKGVNSIFGEGFSPKFRKLRDGMESLGFNATVLMRHDQRRRMYAVPMWPDADAFLRGEQAKVPDYLRKPGRFGDATTRIAEFWHSRLHTAIELGETLWLFTRIVGAAGISEYRILASLVVRSKTINPPSYKYGPFRVWGDLKLSQYFRVTKDPSQDTFELLRVLPLGAGSLKDASRSNLAQACQTIRGLKPKASRLLEAFCQQLPAEERARAVPDEIKLEKALASESWELDSLLGEAAFGYSTRRKAELAGSYSRNRSLAEDLKHLYAGRCQLCAFDSPTLYSVESAETHHIIYRSRGGPDVMENLALLCPNHHTVIHGTDATFDYGKLHFIFSNGRVEPLCLNRHLSARLVVPGRN